MLGLLILTALVIGVSYLCLKIKYMQNYWARKGIKYVPPTFFFGNTSDVVFRRISFSEMIKKVYDYYSDTRYTGFYNLTVPGVILKDPELIKQISVKDFEHFTDHRPLMPDDVDPIFNKNVFALRGEKWKDMRATLSPAFTSSKMKQLFQLINENGKQFAEYFKTSDEKRQDIDVKDILSRFTNDVIATCAFGVNCNSLKDRDNEFFTMGKELTQFERITKNLAFFAYLTAPKLAKMLGVYIFTPKAGAFLKDIVIQSIAEREEKNIKRPDMIHILMEEKKGRLQLEEHDVVGTDFAAIDESQILKTHGTKAPITDDEIAAQAVIFFFAGFETVSTCMSFMAYELAVNPEIQEKLQAEIDETLKRCNGEMTYEALLKMEYMDMVLSESLRKWPPTAAMDRICTKPYTIQPENPDEKPFLVDVGDTLWLPMFPLHRDPKLFSNPDVFDPERFSSENKRNIIPYSYIPFGSGPRACLGSRFALLETKTLFFYLLSNFTLELSGKTKLPIQLNKKNFNMQIEGGLWLNFKPRVEIM